MDQEKALLEGCIKGDRGSQRRLYDLFSKKMMVVCMRYSKSDLEAEDILQESFIKIFDRIKDFRGESRLEYWIKRIVINTALNHQRSKLYLFPMVDVENLNNYEEGSFSLSHFDLKDLLKMIQRLPSGCQVIFNLYAVEGYSHKEIAEKLEISEGTSKSQYARAKSLLREMIEKEERVIYGKAR